MWRPIGNTSRITPNDKFNFGELTPAIAAVDREYFYGSLDRKICDQYSELFADFKYARTFWDGALAPSPFVPDFWTDAAHPRPSRMSQGGVPLQNRIQSFHRAGLRIAWRSYPGSRKTN